MISNRDFASLRILAYNLRYYRDQKGLTQEAVAVATKLSQRTYQTLENGDGNPSLKTLSRLAEFYGVMVSRLLSLSVIKLRHDQPVFEAKLKKTFIDQDLGCLIRSFEGVALWGNRLIAQFANHDVTKTPLDLFSIKSSLPKDILTAQLMAEKAGIIQPYLNSNLGPNGATLYFRIYPTLIFPARGAKPIYSVTYLVPVEKDTEKNYMRFCDLLLNCI